MKRKLYDRKIYETMTAFLYLFIKCFAQSATSFDLCKKSAKYILIPVHPAAAIGMVIIGRYCAKPKSRKKRVDPQIINMDY